MEIDLSVMNDGDIFITQNGSKLVYKEDVFDENNAPYTYCLESIATKNRYFYSKEGVYAKNDPSFNLQARLGHSSNIAGAQTTNSASSVPTLSAWGKGTKIIAIIELLLAVVLFIVLVVNEDLAVAFGVLAYGIIQLFPMMAIAKTCDNSEIILHVLNKLDKQKGGN